MLGYLSDLNTIDLLGLTEPEALPYLQRGDYAWAIRAEPDFVFTPEQTDWPVIAAIYAEPTFAPNYEVVARFHNKPGFDYYLLYQRVTRPPA